MRIIDIRETAVHLQSSVRNSLVDFSQMTVSVVAVVVDQKRNGRSLIGYGFDSIGRYAQGGLLRERFIPRLMDADPAILVDGEGSLYPKRIVQTMMRNEKPGGHGERSAAVAAVELAVWDLLAKERDVPLNVLIAERFNDGHYDERLKQIAELATGKLDPASLEQRTDAAELDRRLAIVRGDEPEAQRKHRGGKDRKHRGGQDRAEL